MLPFTKGKKEKREKRVRKVSDTNHISRPPNCFMIWSRYMREKIYLNKPQLNNADISKQLGLLWKNMTVEEKFPYVIEANRVKYEHKLNNPNYKYKPKSKQQKAIIKNKALNTVNTVKCKKTYITKKLKNLNIILNKESEIKLNTDFLIKEPDYFLEVQQFYAKL